MNELLAILLYLHLVSSPQEYQQSHIEQIEQEHHILIETIYDQPQLFNSIQLEYRDEAEQIVIIDQTST